MQLQKNIRHEELKAKLATRLLPPPTDTVYEVTNRLDIRSSRRVYHRIFRAEGEVAATARPSMLFPCLKGEFWAAYQACLTGLN